MAPNCLENYIGVKCLTQNPKSGFWINDLEGLNLKYAADIADSDHVSGLQFLKSKIDFATEIVLAEIASYALPFFRMNSIIDEMKIGDFSGSYLPVAPLNRGLDVRVRSSRLLRIRVNQIKIRIQETNFSHSLEIQDGLNSFSWPFTTDGNGEAEIFPNFLSSSDRIQILMNDTAIHVDNSSIKTGCGCSSKSSPYLTVTGWNGSSGANSSYGISAQLNAECSFDEIGCILAPRLSFPILYRSGMEIVKEAITSDRLNSITLLDGEKADFLLETFTKEYEKHFKILIESIPQFMRRVDDCCVICNQSRYGITIP